MSRFVLGNCIDVMARIPDNAIDFILTDPPCCVQLIHSILCTVLWTKYLVTQAVPAR
ncbi:methylase [Shigella sonnei]|nr:methylase [Shigella sonnei]